MRLNFKLALTAVVIIGLGAGVGIGMWQTGGQTAQASASGRTGQAGATFAGGGSGATAGAAVANAAMTTGVVDTVGDQQFTVKSNAGSSTTVRVTNETTIRKQATGTVADLQKDERVLVRGTTAADGTVSATSLQIGAADVAGTTGAAPGGANGQGRQAGFGGAVGNGGGSQGGNVNGGGNGQGRQGGAGNGGGNGQARQGAAGNGGQNGGNGQNGGAPMIFGAVQSVDGNVVTILPQSGFGGQSGAQSSASNAPIKVTLTDQTTISKTIDGSFQDIQSGTFVTVRGPSGVDGVVAASNIQVLPADAVQQFRRGQQ